MCNKHVHSTVTRASRFHCLIGVINKPTTVELCSCCSTWVQWEGKMSISLRTK